MKNLKKLLKKTGRIAKSYLTWSTDPSTGQRIAFELKSNVFETPYEQLKGFADAVNSELMMLGYAIAINPITHVQEFWDIVKDNQGKLKKLSLSFNAPNLFGIKDDLNSELKDAQNVFGITKTNFELENADGKLKVPEDSELLIQGVEYITRGGGEFSIKLKGKGKRTISSKKNIETKTFDFEDIEIKTTEPELLKMILNRIFE